MYPLAAFVAGLVFGVGLILAGMVDPAKVLAFLDVSGAWDPSLAFVMAGAIGVAFFAYRYAGQRGASLLGAAMHLPGISHVDRALIAGSAIFGAGWGLAGFCPGPALVALATGHQKALVFVIAMLAGMLLHEVVRTVRRPLIRQK
jgi:uncharacterized membrane protein YedE/YeeE